MSEDVWKKMLIAIVHYHLRSGGVTQVIANHLRALQLQAGDLDQLRVVILHGGRQDGWPGSFARCPHFGIYRSSDCWLGLRRSTSE
jgi:hypothetical protein